jgi:riboflavin kinase
MHPFPSEFYGHRMSIVVLGYIRPELNYISKGEIVALGSFLLGSVSL